MHTFSARDGALACFDGTFFAAVNREPPQAVYSIGEHSLIRRINALVCRIAATDTAELITSASGTGKKVIARNIHNLSQPGAPAVRTTTHRRSYTVYGWEQGTGHPHA